MMQIWNESYSLITGDLTDVPMSFYRNMANNCREKSAEDIVLEYVLLWGRSELM